MTDRADAHIHLFEGAFQDAFTARPGVRLDEAACYESLMADHGVVAALIVGYGDRPYCVDNQAFLERMLPDHPWMRPVVYRHAEEPLCVAELEDLEKRGFLGLSLYIFSEAREKGVEGMDDDILRWLVEHRWLISVNSTGDGWKCWIPVLERFGDLRVLVSHLGLPGAVPVNEEADVSNLATVLALADYPGPRVKLSGFYASTVPGHDYPHRSAWPYVEALKGAFGVDRLLWASDYSPHLEWLTYPQTMDLFAMMPFFTESDCEQILGGNLLGLFEQ